VDWGLGEYELVARQLLGAAEAVVDHAAPLPGEHVLDLGCGTGNATLLAARRGARVTGVDPAARLLGVAGQRLREDGLEARLLEGEAGQLPLSDGGVDVGLSVFGVIFAPDAGQAISELARVCAERARVVISAWVPGGPIAETMRLRGEALSRLQPAGAPASPFAWYDRATVAAAFEPFGFQVDSYEHRLAFTADSASEFVDRELRIHPSWVSARALLEAHGELSEVRERVLDVLDAANQDPHAFQVTSDYVVMVARR
jgi:SAM-dependent methyltransferase